MNSTAGQTESQQINMEKLSTEELEIKLSAEKLSAKFLGDFDQLVATCENDPSWNLHHDQAILTSAGNGKCASCRQYVPVAYFLRVSAEEPMDCSRCFLCKCLDDFVIAAAQARNEDLSFEWKIGQYGRSRQHLAMLMHRYSVIGREVPKSDEVFILDYLSSFLCLKLDNAWLTAPDFDSIQSSDEFLAQYLVIPPKIPAGVSQEDSESSEKRPMTSEAFALAATKGANKLAPLMPTVHPLQPSNPATEGVINQINVLDLGKGEDNNDTETE